MISEDVRKEIEAEFAHNELKRGACIEALKIVQKHYQWVSDEHLAELAPILEMSVEDLDDVATFYNLIYRQPVGKHIILVCNSVSCWLMGYDKIRQHLSDRLGVDLGETTADDQFTLLPMVCLGDCDHAPAMMVDEELHHDLTAEKIDQILTHFAED
jgi:NADH-quinone oxidoreductase subunit E